MKNSLFMAALLTLFAVAIPLYTYKDKIAATDKSVLPQSSSQGKPSANSGTSSNSDQSSSEKTSSDSEQSSEYSSSQNASRPAASLEIDEFEDLEYLQIYNLSTGKVDKVAMADYVRGAVAAEMPPSFHAEAMKAQAVSAHTYALYQHYFQAQFPNPDLKGADFAADPANIKGYATEVAMRRRYGNMGDEYWGKIADAADSVLGYVMVYDNQPIIAAYHSASGGITEDASNVWSNEVPYLKPVESPGDLLVPEVIATVTMTKAEVKQKFEKAFPGVKLQANPQDWIVINETSDSGYALLVDVGNISVHGKDLRTALDLKSSYVDIKYSADNFTFTTKGYGHGIGLSQYGSDYMARQGSTFDEILTHYYTGAELAMLG